MVPTGPSDDKPPGARPMTGWLDRLAPRRRPTGGGDAADSKVAGGEPAAASGSGERIAVVTDSAAALPDTWVNQARARGAFAMVPMPVMIDGDIFGEGVDDLHEALCSALATGRPVRTSRPSPGQFTRLYEELAARGITAIVSVHISGSLSGTADAARLAATTALIPVQVVDSRTVGMAQGFAVQAALAAAEAGGTGDDAAAAAARAAEACSVYFYVPSLEQLRRGGRIGSAAAWLGTVLSVKPILGIRNGAVVPIERIRSAVKAVGRLEEIALAGDDDVTDEAEEAGDAAARDSTSGRTTFQWAVHHFENQESAQQLSIRLGLRTGDTRGGQLTTLPAVLAAHTGLGAFGVVINRSGPDPGPSTDSSSTPPE